MIIKISKEAQDIINTLKNKYKELVFFLSSGCCDGTTLMCYEKNDFIVPNSSIKLGKICDFNFYTSEIMAKNLKDTNLQIDIKKEQALSNSFSLEIDLGYEFIVKYFKN